MMNIIYIIILEDLGTHCAPAAMLERFPQMIIVGFNEKMTTVGDFQLCIELCLDSTRNFGFVCRSIMFYSERVKNLTSFSILYECYLLRSASNLSFSVLWMGHVLFYSTN